MSFSDGSGAPPGIERDSFASEIHGITATLARLSDAQERRLMVPLVPKTAVKVWYTRDPALSSFDPLEMLLRTICQELGIQERLPGAEELSGYVGLVVASRAVGGKLGLDQCSALLKRVPAASGLWLTAERDEPLPVTNEPRLKVANWPVSIQELPLFNEF